MSNSSYNNLKHTTVFRICNYYRKIRYRKAEKIYVGIKKFTKIIICVKLDQSKALIGVVFSITVKSKRISQRYNLRNFLSAPKRRRPAKFPKDDLENLVPCLLPTCRVVVCYSYDAFVERNLHLYL